MAEHRDRERMYCGSLEVTWHTWLQRKQENVVFIPSGPLPPEKSMPVEQGRGHLGTLAAVPP
jgi:hypothetical protein